MRESEGERGRERKTGFKRGKATGRMETESGGDCTVLYVVVINWTLSMLH